MTCERQSLDKTFSQFLSRRYVYIAGLALGGILIHLFLRFGVGAAVDKQLWPLWTVLIVGGIPLIGELLAKLLHREFGSDLLAGISIITSIFLEEYLAGSLVVLMLSGGEALESYAIRSASRALEVLARRMPSVAHRRHNGQLTEVEISRVRLQDELIVFPHEICPVDGVVVEGHSAMDESYLTGEPYVLSKTPGSKVLSGSVNGEGALTIRAEKRPTDSRYAKIVEVMAHRNNGGHACDGWATNSAHFILQSRLRSPSWPGPHLETRYAFLLSWLWRRLVRC